MQSNVDWLAIRSEFEQGLSQRSLALKYGIEQSTISRRATKENWRIIPRITPTSECISDASDISKLSNLEIVEKAIADLYKHLEAGHLELTQHKLFADALNQYNKIKLTLPPEEQDLSQYDLRLLLADATPEELAIVQPIFATIDARRKPLKKTG